MDKPDSAQQMPLFIISGGKGVAGHTLVRGLLIQYPDNKIHVNIIPNVQTDSKIKEVVNRVKRHHGLIVHTMVNAHLREFLIATCKKCGVDQIDLMGDLANFLEQRLGLISVNVPGLYRRINAQYYERIEAIEYALNHDDGVNPNRLFDAEIILTGVSRAGKTPLSVYMSMFGWKVANVPLVKGIAPPPELFKLDPRRVFGLNINLSTLLSMRQKRLEQMQNTSNTHYVDPDFVKQEIRHAHFVFERGGFTIINVTNKPIETTANEIIGLITDRFGLFEQKKKPAGRHFPPDSETHKKNH